MLHMLKDASGQPFWDMCFGQSTRGVGGVLCCGVHRQLCTKSLGFHERVNQSNQVILKIEYMVPACGDALVGVDLVARDRRHHDSLAVPAQRVPQHARHHAVPVLHNSHMDGGLNVMESARTTKHLRLYINMTTYRHVRPFLVQREDDHLEVEERLVDVLGLAQRLPLGRRLVHTLRPREIHQIQLRP